MVAKPLCPLYKNIIKHLDRARYPELRYNFNRCIIASISYNFNSFKDKYNGSGSAEDEINRF